MTTAEPRSDPATITVRNPADGRTVGSVPVDEPDTVAAKARELRLAQTEWESIGPRSRKTWMLKWQNWVLDNADHLTEVLMSETGKSRGDASVEPVAVADAIDYWAGNAEAFLTDRTAKPHTPLYRVKKLTTVYRPFPLVGIIEPWNFPLAMLALDVVPALAAGAAVMLKPSEVTPLSAVEFVRGWVEVGALPVLAVSTGYAATGQAVIQNSDYVHFTGSTATGRKVAVACAERLTPFSLELGGKDPAIVLADADLDRAANGIAWGGMFNSGQVCISVERVFVEAPVYDEFVGKLTERVRNIKQGSESGGGLRYDTGAMATAAQRDIVERHVNEATAAGARILTGGTKTGVGTFFSPTVLADVDPAMSCMTEETFGPTLPVLKVADEEEAIRMANDSTYGLSASVWTGDTKRGQRVARRLECGAVNINDALINVFCPSLPMGGWKDSGIGYRAGGPNGVLKFCRQQAITAPRSPTQKSEPLWYSAPKGQYRFALAAMRAFSAHGWRRLGGHLGTSSRMSPDGTGRTG
ncbi:aldehyde dehydrogenase [Mycobacterium antarcticum]|uniref:aldehyde dehydrogenase family protein n=1 Tax=Mycolicibacterium sp. TUM20983 TaxID=3023369 RepID=UPI0023965833|nr:aldehyde dehydrogenase family protein [Mycolicibacterium sp. TUM20983]GLP76835.1 aldehyde dehydrogenase [Mycolicibacterium sp. TUM20983]